MDKLKFRCWDREAKTFLPQFLDDYQWILPNVEQNSFCGIKYVTLKKAIETPEKYNIQIGTGLLDFMDNTVYEGDIVKRPNDSLSNYYVVYWNIPAAKFNLQKFQMHKKLINATNYSAHSIPQLKVIGNIFENSELIKNYD